jgi:Flp pilus assembly protein TadD
MSRRRSGLRGHEPVAAGRLSTSHRGAAANARAADDPIEALILRSRRCRQKGDTRRALVLLREACVLEEWRPRTWALLGALLVELSRRDEASAAFGQARWLRLRTGDSARAAVLDRLAAGLRPLAA